MRITASGVLINDMQQEMLPIRVVEQHDVENANGLIKICLPDLPPSVSFESQGWTCFNQQGSYVVLDFGKEVCGGIRMVVRTAKNLTKWRLTFGESLTEACSGIGEKNATNHHSPRDFEIQTSNMSDLEFGHTGFRFVRVELLEDNPSALQNIFAVNHLPVFEKEAKIVTNDVLLNEIIATAVYTLKLNFQKGYIWDGIKRDRLVWCGDLHPEVISSLYMFGDTDNVKNALSFLRQTTPCTKWINEIPSYSAWWVVNLCDYCLFTNNMEFFAQNREYALQLLKRFNECCQDDGAIQLVNEDGREFFLDWSTNGHHDAKAGVASLISWMAQKYLLLEENEDCRDIIKKLAIYLDMDTVRKPVRAFQILAGRQPSEEDVKMLQKDGARDFSTFMAYYILKAMSVRGGTEMLTILKEYYGGMLSVGATTFWEDFDIDWLKEPCARIDEFPEEGQKDIHADYGKYCYQQLRHSLCHGWSSGVLAFIVEYILGVQFTDNGKTLCFHPHMLGLTDIEAVLPIKDGELGISIHNGDVQLSAPQTIQVKKSFKGNTV